MAGKRKPKSSTWRCFECGATGTDGTAGWTAHWISEHQNPPF